MSYSPTLGRWMQRDSAGYVDGASLYQYERSDAASGVDPTGLQYVPDNSVETRTTRDPGTGRTQTLYVVDPSQPPELQRLLNEINMGIRGGMQAGPTREQLAELREFTGPPKQQSGDFHTESTKDNTPNKKVQIQNDSLKPIICWRDTKTNGVGGSAYQVLPPGGISLNGVDTDYFWSDGRWIRVRPNPLWKGIIDVWPDPSPSAVDDGGWTGIDGFLNGIYYPVSRGDWYPGALGETIPEDIVNQYKKLGGPDAAMLTKCTPIRTNTPPATQPDPQQIYTRTSDDTNPLIPGARAPIDEH